MLHFHPEFGLSYGMLVLVELWYKEYITNILLTCLCIAIVQVLNSGTLCLPQQSSQALPGSNLAYRAVPEQLLSERSYSQPTLPLGESANMIGYPSMPRSQTYVPSALQQAYQGSSTYHDSVAGMNYNLSQYRNGATMSSLPLSNDNNSAYRSFVGNSNNIPGNFLHNMSTSPTRSAVGYNDLLHYQYRDGNSSTRFQQVETMTT